MLLTVILVVFHLPDSAEVVTPVPDVEQMQADVNLQLLGGGGE